MKQALFWLPHTLPYCLFVLYAAFIRRTDSLRKLSKSSWTRNLINFFKIYVICDKAEGRYIQRVDLESSRPGTGDCRCRGKFPFVLWSAVPIDGLLVSVRNRQMVTRPCLWTSVVGHGVAHGVTNITLLHASNLTNPFFENAQTMNFESKFSVIVDVHRYWSEHQ